MAFDEKDAIRVLLKGRAAPAQSPIPPGHRGLRPEAQDAAQLYDPAASRALLDRFGYKDRDGDGYRETPDGKPLALEFWSAPTLIARQTDELLKKNMDAIGIRMVFKKDKTPELRKMARLGKIPMRADGWNADYPGCRRTTCSSSTVPTPGRRTRPASSSPNSMRSTTARASCPIRRSAPCFSAG
jgi:ABC-type transport system substrate-binding protein